MNKDIIAKSIEVYGKEMQSVVCMEECSELIRAISKELRGESNRRHLAEEMADVLICIEMLKQMYDIQDVDIDAFVQVKQGIILDRMVNKFLQE